MASFDFVEASSKGYEFVWNARSYLLRAALPVILIRFVCILFVQFMKVEDQNLLSGLIFMPAYILEALYMVSLVRYVAFREPLFDFGRVVGINGGINPVPKGDVAENEAGIQAAKNVSLFAKERIFKAGVAVYLLIKVIQQGLAGVILDYGNTLDPDVPLPPPEQNAASAFIVMGFTCIMLWVLRLMWLYIPVALGYSARGFLERIKGMMISLSIFATWFVCNFPVMIVFYGVFMVVNQVLVPESFLQVFVHDIIRASGETIVVLVQVVAMTYGFIEVLTQVSEKK
jgi:hypothetical protein